MHSYDDMTEEQRRAVVEAAAYARDSLPSGAGAEGNVFRRLDDALKPPSPLPSDEELYRIFYPIGCGHLTELERQRAVYAHALREMVPKIVEEVMGAGANHSGSHQGRLVALAAYYADDMEGR